MTISINKKLLAYLLGIAMALTIALPALLIGHEAAAASHLGTGALTGEELFGGEAEEFAAQAGLGAGDLTETIAALIRTALGFLGIVAVIIVLFGGFKWMTAGGNEDKVTEAKKLMISGVIGLVIVLSAFALAQFVITQLSQATAG